MKDKLVKRNKSHFDFVARRLGIIGSIIIVLSIAFGIPVLNSLQNRNHNLVNDIQKEEKYVSNLHLQLEDGSIRNN